jgi:hypothetical protein
MAKADPCLANPAPMCMIMRHLGVQNNIKAA